MTNCYMCNEEINRSLTWTSLFFDKKESPLCGDCEGKLAWISGERCTICSRELSEKFRQGTLCLDCVRWEKDPEWAGYLTENNSLFHYNEFMKEMIAKYKYRGDYALAEVFSFYLKDHLLDYDLITFIPLSEERLKERGFNQAQALLDVAKIEYTPLLTRMHTEKQSKKSRKERIMLPQVFKVTESVRGKRIVIIDDIYTTGSTLRHAAKALKLAGASTIQSITIAR